MEWCLYCFMGAAAGMDLLKREIPCWLYWIFGVAGAAYRIISISAPENGGFISVLSRTAESLAVGLGLLLISRIAEGAVGEGDGWFFVVAGFYLSWKINLGLLCYGLFLCSIGGIILMLWGRWKGVSARKMKVPFLPFVCLGCILMAAGNMWEV